MSHFGTPLEGPEIQPSVKQKDVDYQIEYDIEVKPIKRKNKRISKRLERLLHAAPLFIFRAEFQEQQKEYNKAMSDIISEFLSPKKGFTFTGHWNQNQQRLATHRIYNKLEPWGA
jgi:hypothetical protein